MEWWYVLIFAPLYSIFQALREAWYLLLDAADESERQRIMLAAGARAFLYTGITAAMMLVPWPYNLLLLAPSLMKFAQLFMHRREHTQEAAGSEHRRVRRTRLPLNNT